VVAVDIWRDLVTLRDGEGARRTIHLDALKDEVSSRGDDVLALRAEELAARDQEEAGPEGEIAN